MPAIAIRHLSKTFEQKGNSVEALRDISLDIEEGDIYGIIGMSGAGKSTLVRCLNYLERPTSGEVIIGGRDLGTLTEKELREQRSDIAMIFQHFNLLMQKSVLDNVCFPMQIAKKKKDEAKKRALELLETVGLADKADAYPAQLSGGQKQRVAIARALATDPKILLCDEAQCLRSADNAVHSGTLKGDQPEIRHHDCDYHASDVRDPGNLQPCGDCGKRKHRGSRPGRGDFQPSEIPCGEKPDLERPCCGCRVIFRGGR